MTKRRKDVRQKERAHGVYAIVDDRGRLLYIGKTHTRFAEGWTYHRRHVDETLAGQATTQPVLYNALARLVREGRDYRFKIVLNTTQLRDLLKVRDVELAIDVMERLLIAALEPPCNVEFVS